VLRGDELVKQTIYPGQLRRQLVFVANLGDPSGAVWVRIHKRFTTETSQVREPEVYNAGGHAIREYDDLESARKDDSGL